jgi:hypothetical protein
MKKQMGMESSRGTRRLPIKESNREIGKVLFLPSEII